jgi:tripartite ATP-independent transporter DctP family solute receptor
VALPRFAHAAEFNYKVATNLPPDHPSNVRLNEAASRIFKQTDGQLKLTVYPSSQLGTDTDTLSQLRVGAVEMFELSGVILSTLLPVTAITGIGFAFPSYKQVWEAVDGELGAYLRGQISKVGLYAFEKQFDNGFREITTSSRQIHTPADLKNLKIRVPPSPLWTSLFEALGAAPATVNFSEVYSALQTHIVDGQENPLTLIVIAKLYEVQKYVAMTNHMWDGFWILGNARAMQALPPKTREILNENTNKAAMEQRADLLKLNVTSENRLKSDGMTFTTTNPEAFRAVLHDKGWYADWKKRMGAETWGILEKYSGKLA